MKKILITMMTSIIMTMNASIVFAESMEISTENEINTIQHILNYDEVSSDYTTIKGFTDNKESLTRGWGGPAPYVTKVEMYNKDVNLPNGNYGIILKVTGYGNDRGKAMLNKEAVVGEMTGYFIDYGISADGFYYTYDLGKYDEESIKGLTFETVFSSTNNAWIQKEFNYTFK